MATIRLVDAAKFYKGQPHQIAAWNALQEHLTAEQVSTFAELYRSAPPVKEPASTIGHFWPSCSFSWLVTAHISYGEFALGHEDRRFRYQYQCDTALKLANFLETVRTEFKNKPLVITSGYRPPAVNAAVGGAVNSEHLFNVVNTGAVDFFVEGADIHAVQAYCDKKWPYSIGYGAYKGFVHLGMRAGLPRVRWDY